MDPRYPVGRFAYDGPADQDRIASWIDEIERLPQELRAAVEGLSETQLETPYREGGWTVRQVVHHVLDSHVNSYVRLKVGLTEQGPTIRPYEEKGWALTPEYDALPVEHALALLELLHERMVAIYRAMSPADFDRVIVHPESGPGTLARHVALYAWHGRHHVAHVRLVRDRS